MSWIIGITGKNPSLKKSIQQLHPNPLFTKETENFYLAAGGNPSTCFYSNKNPDEIWVAVGVGLLCNDSNYKIMDSNDWEIYYSNRNPVQSELNGHYVFITLNSDNVEIQTDKLGLREIYIYSSTENTIFCTRLDWIGKLTEVGFDIPNLAGVGFFQVRLQMNLFLKTLSELQSVKSVLS